MACYFCDRGAGLLPGYTGKEQYHEYQPDVGGYPMCAYPFYDREETHPFLLAFKSEGCDFCHKLRDDPIHKLKGAL